ncbi:MAG: response regulator transcription factor [Lachnospiraceae bacterium]|nr:response regulator transcription factor [Lachnospiraceae bacterium]
MQKILIAEDDVELSQLFSCVLTGNGYSVTAVQNGAEALDALHREYFDLLISDIMMPVMNGYELVHSLREAEQNIPVLMITAKGGFDDMEEGFRSGVDDYMVKPVNINEMVLRVNALLRRARIQSERRLVIGSTTLECDTLTVTVGDTTTILPQKEFMLLYKMASYTGKIFTRKQLMDEVWGYDGFADTHTVEVHIGRLRERFRDNSDFSIITIRGVGYKVVKK